MQIYRYIVLLPLVTSACIPLPLQPKYSQQSMWEQKLVPETDNEMRLSEIKMVSSGNPVWKIIRVANYIQPSLWYSERISTSPIGSKPFNDAKPKSGTSKLPKTVWNSALFPQDFSHLEKLCEQFNLLTQGDIQVPKMVKPLKHCDSSTDEVKIYLRSQSGQENTFIIAGNALCAGEYIPQGVKKVMGELDALISKYQPSPNIQVALLDY
jgi:hypothetical protein